MDSTLSVSKGCFVFKPEKSKKKKRHQQPAGYEREAWYPAFTQCWKLVEDKIQGIFNTAFSEVLGHVVAYLKLCRTDPVFADVVPAVALLTGVSVSDHAALFAAVCDKLRQEVTPHVVSLHGDECRTVKAALEKLVSQFVSKDQGLDDTITEFKVKKSKCTFTLLSGWYKSVSSAMPDSEVILAGCDGSSLPCSAEVANENADLLSYPLKHAFSNSSTNFLGKLSTLSPVNSAKKSNKSPFKQIFTPTKSPRKLMAARKLLLQFSHSDKINKFTNSKSSSPSDNAKKFGNSKLSCNSPCKYGGPTSPLQSPRKDRTSRLCKIKSDLSESFGNTNSSDKGVPSYKVELQVPSTKSPDILGRSPNRQIFSKMGSPSEVGSEPFLELNIRNSFVALTRLEVNLTPSPPNGSKSECWSRRRSSKRPASTSPCQSPEVKKKKDGQHLLCQPLLPSQSRSTRRRAAVTPLAGKPLLVVVIPDFESFSPAVLKDLILIASGYVQELPLVFVFGVATTIAAVHRSLPHHVSSKICIQVFQSHFSLDLLNQVVDQVLLCSDCPFLLGRRTFRLLSDIFLHYDFSVQAFVQRLKFCMLEHFVRGCAGLCCPAKQLPDVVEALNEEELDRLRHLASFRRYVESRPRVEQAPLLEDDELFKEELERLLCELHEHVCQFYDALRCLHALTASLPKAPLGTNLRELYSMAVSAPVAEMAQYGECRRLLDLQSRDELEARLAAASAALAGRQLGDLADRLPRWVEQLQFLVDVRTRPLKSPLKSPLKLNFDKSLSRSQFMQKICEVQKKVRPLSVYEELRKQVVTSLMQEILPAYLVPPTSLPFHEVLLFDELYVKQHLVPSPRAAIHTALDDPLDYLQCNCCQLPEPGAILPTMPDICIAYKLHLESGKLVNLYDWLQAFVAVVCPGDGEESQEVDPRVQARFTRAVSELQFLGFIKSSRKKTDHVMRTTWGAC